MNTIKILRVSDIKTENRTKDSKKNRELFSVMFKGVSGLFDDSTALNRNFFQRHNADGSQAYWSLAVPYEKIKAAEGASIPGQIISVAVTPHNVEIGGQTRVCRQMRAVVLPHESVEVITNMLKAKAQAIADKQAEEIAVEEPEVSADNGNAPEM